MVVSRARVATERPASYLTQLCEHFADTSQRHSAQEFEVTFDDHEGFIDFAPVIGATCSLDAREKGVLVLDVSATDTAALDRVQRIVGKHLGRFARGDELTVEWTSAADRPPTR